MVRYSRSGRRCSVPWICFVCSFVFRVAVQDIDTSGGFVAVAAREASGTTGEGAGVDAATDVPAGGRLVRVPIDELQQAEQK
jgi:hypothetical protein